MPNRPHFSRHGGIAAPRDSSNVVDPISEFAAGDQGWRKDARVPGPEVALARDAIARLRALGLVRIEGAPATAVTPLPAIGRFGLREAEEEEGGEELAEAELF